MGLLFLLLLIVLFPIAVQAQVICPTVQSSPQFSAPGTVFGRLSSNWNTYFNTKVDANNGILCSPTFGGNVAFNNPQITGGLQLLSGTLKGVPLPVALTDAVNKQYVDSKGIGVVAVLNNLNLQAITPPLPGTEVYRQGLSTPGDGGGAFYVFSGTPCSIAGGAGDNGSQVAPSIGTGCWNADFPAAGASLKVWGTNSVALQAAVKWASGVGGGPILLPPGSYTLNTAIDAHNINQLVIKGAGCEKPAFGLANVAPTTGSILIGNTGGAVIDAVGSNNVKFQDFCISSIGAATPSTIGVILGNSTGSQQGSPGGTAITLIDFGVQLTNTGAGTIPIYYNGGGLSGFYNVWTLGNYGLVLGSSNPLSVAPPYSSFGAPIGTDGVFVSGSAFLGYGSKPPVYITDCDNVEIAKSYIDTIFGGPSFSGSPNALFLHNVIDVSIYIEEDYFPYLLFATGFVQNVHIVGSVFRLSTPLGANNPIIGFFDQGQVFNSSFAVEDATGTNGLTNYWYTMNGSTPSVTKFANNEFVFNQTVSANVLFGNLTTGSQYYNIRFNGTVDGTTSLNVNNTTAPTSSVRAFMNGLRVGTL